MAFCTNCGKELSSFTVVCPACGCEVQGRQAADSVRKFYVDITHAQTTKEKADLIKNYPIPNTKEDIFEFMMAASSNVLREEEKEIYEAWLEEGGDNGSCQEQWRTKLEGWFLVLVKMQRMFWKKRKIWRFR